MEEKKSHGGSRKGAGRKSKAEEQNLIEKLGKFEDTALQQLEYAVGEGKSWAIKLYMEYSYGKPRETKDVNLSGDLPIFDI